MNFFQKIKLVNKISKIIKEIKKYLNSTHVDDELKEIFAELKSDILKLVEKIPEIQGLVQDIMVLIK